MTKKIREEYKKAGLYINIDKTKYLGEDTSDMQLDKNDTVEGCDSYKYLGVTIEKMGRDEKEIREQITQRKKGGKIYLIVYLTVYGRTKTLQRTEN